MNKTIPAVSIIIPMYNAEKYIGECLDSILAQTFDDYEVIVVDNCSTDNSAAVVESYIPKFTAEKLRLIRRKINSGGPATPRNTGMRVARGEYVFFMDSDDAIMPEALAELYAAAEKFDADVVHCGKFFNAPEDTVTTDKIFLTEASIERGGVFADVPILESENLADRVQKFAEHKTAWAPWVNLIRREFLLKNDIKFGKLSISDDFVFSFFVGCRAEKFLLMPNVLYVYRTLQDSLSRGHVGAIDKFIHKRVGDFFRGMKLLDDFMNEFELFRTQPYYKYIVFDLFAANCALEAVARAAYAQIPAFQLDALIRAEFENVKDNSAAVAFLFARMNAFNLSLIRQTQIIQRQQQQIQQLQAQPSQFQLQSEDIFK